MANVAHSTLTGADLHEPKGVGAAAANRVYVSNGAGSGTWQKITSSEVDSTVGGALVHINTQTASAVSQIDFVNGVSGVVFDSTYNLYMFKLSNVRPATDNVDLYIRVGTGGTPTWQTGASAYKSSTSVILTGVGNTSAVGTATDKILTTYNGGGSYAVGNGAGENISGDIHVNAPSSSSDYPKFRFHLGWWGANNELGASHGVGYYLTTTAITGVRFFFSSGNITSGSFSLYGIRTS